MSTIPPRERYEQGNLAWVSAVAVALLGSPLLIGGILFTNYEVGVYGDFAGTEYALPPLTALARSLAAPFANLPLLLPAVPLALFGLTGLAAERYRRIVAAGLMLLCLLGAALLVTGTMLPMLTGGLARAIEQP